MQSGLSLFLAHVIWQFSQELAPGVFGLNRRDRLCGFFSSLGNDLFGWSLVVRRFNHAPSPARGAGLDACAVTFGTLLVASQKRPCSPLAFLTPQHAVAFTNGTALSGVFSPNQREVRSRGRFLWNHGVVDPDCFGLVKTAHFYDLVII